MNLEASEVFYGQNHFLLTPNKGLEIELFLGYIGRNAAKNLRSFEIVVNKFIHGIEPERWETWDDGMDVFEEQATIPSLCIIIRCTGQHSYYDEKMYAELMAGNDKFFHEFSKLDPFHEDFKKLASTFSGLKGLRSFELDVDWTTVNDEEDPARYSEEKERVEKRVENVVMRRNLDTEVKKKKRNICYHDFKTFTDWDSGDDYIVSGIIPTRESELAYIARLEAATPDDGHGEVSSSPLDYSLD